MRSDLIKQAIHQTIIGFEVLALTQEEVKLAFCNLIISFVMAHPDQRDSMADNLKTRVLPALAEIEVNPMEVNNAGSDTSDH